MIALECKMECYHLSHTDPRSKSLMQSNINSYCIYISNHLAQAINNLMTQNVLLVVKPPIYIVTLLTQVPLKI